MYFDNYLGRVCRRPSISVPCYGASKEISAQNTIPQRGNVRCHTYGILRRLCPPDATNITCLWHSNGRLRCNFCISQFKGLNFRFSAFARSLMNNRVTKLPKQLRYNYQDIGFWVWGNEQYSSNNARNHCIFDQFPLQGQTVMKM